MNKKRYQSAIDHLRFSDCEYESVLRKAVPQRRFRPARIIAIAALVCMFVTTAFATSSDFRNWSISLLRLGTSQKEMENALAMEFQHDEQSNGISIHYLELDRMNYTFFHGMLFSPEKGYLRITDDYRLEPVELQHLSASLSKNGRNYSTELDYLQTNEGLLTSYINILRTSEEGEVFLNLTDGNSNQWPAYVNLSTGAVRDALPFCTGESFSGRITYSYELRNGILLSTLVDEDKLVNGNSTAYNLLYWIDTVSSKTVPIHLPADEAMWYCENDELYYKNNYGHLFRMNESFEFELLYNYRTGDDLTNGLYTVATEGSELGIVDVYTGEIYTITDYIVDPGAPEGYRGYSGGEMDETMGINATRYTPDGSIALIETYLDTEHKRVSLRKLGVLDKEAGQLRLVEIENKYDGYTIRWLDQNRLAVIYDSQYLCIYEFQ